MKCCYYCKQTKGDAEFTCDRTRKDGLSNICRDCKNANKRLSRGSSNGPKVKAIKGVAELRRNMKARSNRHSVISEYKKSGCCLCGYNKCPRALEFHHVDSNKEYGISGMHVSLARIKVELSKCICVCANCHREIHSGMIEGYMDVNRATPFAEEPPLLALIKSKKVG